MLLKTSREAYTILCWGPDATIEDEHSFGTAAYKACGVVEMMMPKLKHLIETGKFDPSIN